MKGYDQLKLLLVDDEENFRQVIVKRLRKRGLSPMEAASGEECLSIFEKEPMDVVVLDVKMPGMSGLDVLRRIKARFDKTEVILLTGHASTEDGVAGIKAGAFDYLTKPVELDHLAGKIRQAYDKIIREKEKAQEAEFREKMTQRMIAAERLASLGTLAAGVAHEINNPLAIINDAVGWMKLLLERDDWENMHAKPHLEKGFDKIEKSVERAKRITHQLLSFARNDPSDIQTEVDLCLLVHETIELVQKEAKNKDVAIVVEDHPSLVKLWSDPYQLKQVIINLLNNAIHATPAKGKISVLLRTSDAEISLSVADTGVGIPADHLQSVFEPFFSTKSPGQGTGLGLFVTRGIVEKLGGTIDVESQPGVGTCFHVKLPKVDPEEAV